MGADYRIAVKSMLIFQADNNIGAAQTAYIGSGGTAGTIPRSEFRVPFDCIIDYMHARSELAPGVGETFDYTLMVNGIATALITQIAGALFESEDLVNQIAVQRGQRVCVRLVTSALAAAGRHSASVRVKAT